MSPHWYDNDTQRIQTEHDSRKAILYAELLIVFLCSLITIN